MIKYLKLILWSLVIAYLCFSPASEFKKVHIFIPHFDKLVHFVMFFILALLIAGIEKKEWNNFSKITLSSIAVVYGGIIELVQYGFIEGRNGDLMDWMADTTGIAFGLLLFSYLPLKVQKYL